MFFANSAILVAMMFCVCVCMCVWGVGGGDGREGVCVCVMYACVKKKIHVRDRLIKMPLFDKIENVYPL